MSLSAVSLPCGCVRYLPKHWTSVRCDECRKEFTNHVTPPVRRKKGRK